MSPLSLLLHYSGVEYFNVIHQSACFMVIPYSLGACPDVPHLGVGPQVLVRKRKKHMGNRPSHHALGTQAFPI